jgi:glycosyltransferase involved in cell wall biosynthesis
MKILLATESYHPNIDGGAIAQHRLVLELQKKGHDVAVCAPGPCFKNITESDNGSIEYRPRSLTLPIYMNNSYQFSPFPINFIYHVIKTFKPDIVDICSPYPIGASTLILSKKQNIPVVGSIHMLPENMLSPFMSSKYYSRMRKLSWAYLVYFFNKVDQATIPTQTGADMYHERGLTVPITPISNGVNTQTFNPNNDGKYLRDKFKIPEKPTVLYTGRMSSEKNVDVIIKAIPDVVNKLDAHFLFCGSGGGYKQRMKQLAESLNISDHTTFVDFLDWDDYPNIYSLANLFVMPAESELQSIVTMEAIASGLPAVVVNKGAVPELVNQDNGLLFEPQNSNHLAKCITTILSDDQLKKKMSINSLKLIQQHTMSYVVKQYENVYYQLLNSE